VLTLANPPSAAVAVVADILMSCIGVGVHESQVYSIYNPLDGEWFTLDEIIDTLKRRDGLYRGLSSSDGARMHMSQELDDVSCCLWECVWWEGSEGRGK
jgi:hypothetical protein